MNDLKGIIEDCNKSDLVSKKVIKKVIEIIGQEEWNDLYDEQSDICTTMGEVIITLKGITDLEKENAELLCQKNRNKSCYSCANATERCFRNEIGCPCQKYKSYTEENAELKQKYDTLLEKVNLSDTRFADFVEADKNLKAVVADFNKANEWHYPSKGELPKCDDKTQLIFYVNCYYEIGGKTITRKRTVLGYYQNSFLNDDIKLFVEKSKGYEDEHLPKDVIAWKEIVLPKEIKENDNLMG